MLEQFTEDVAPRCLERFEVVRFTGPGGDPEVVAQASLDFG